MIHCRYHSLDHHLPCVSSALSLSFSIFIIVVLGKPYSILASLRQQIAAVLLAETILLPSQLPESVPPPASTRPRTQCWDTCKDAALTHAGTHGSEASAVA